MHIALSSRPYIASRSVRLRRKGHACVETRVCEVLAHDGRAAEENLCRRRVAPLGGNKLVAGGLPIGGRQEAGQSVEGEARGPVRGSTRRGSFHTHLEELGPVGPAWPRLGAVQSDNLRRSECEA